MNKLKVAIVLGTRPEIIRLSRVIKIFDENFNLVLIHTGQNYDYELNQIFFDNLGVRQPDYFLNSASESRSASETIGRIISTIDDIFVTENPDALLVLGDTNSCLSVIPAKKRRIPIFHMEAGNRCFDQRVPEETNRKIVDHVSDINLTYSRIAREYLLREGVPPDQIIVTGSPMYEVIAAHLSQIERSKILSDLSLDQSGFFLISVHREENVDNIFNFELFCSFLISLSNEYCLPIVVSTHPRTAKKIAESGVDFGSRIRFLKPLGFFDYVKLQMMAKIVFSDSGTISEESSILNFPALNLREAHERPEAMEEGSVMMVGLNYNRIKQAITVLETQVRGEQRQLNVPADYDVTNVSLKVLRIVLSYTDYIKRRVWREDV